MHAVCVHTYVGVHLLFSASDQVHAWTDIGQDRSDMETLRSLHSQSFQFFSIIKRTLVVSLSYL